MPEGPLVAIVDDDESIRETTKDLLESAGLPAAAFTSAESFLRSKRLHRFSCLIADMRMSGMSGLELYQELAASNRAIPTILVTAHPEERARAQAAKAKVLCFLTKPFVAEDLLACVRRAIEGRQRRAPAP